MTTKPDFMDNGEIKRPRPPRQTSKGVSKYLNVSTVVLGIDGDMTHCRPGEECQLTPAQAGMLGKKVVKVA